MEVEKYLSVPTFNGITVGDVKISKKSNTLFQIVFDKVSRNTLFQTWSTTDPELNKSRLIIDITIDEYIEYFNGSQPFRPTVIMDTGKCQYAFVINTVDKTNGKLIWNVGTNEINDQDKVIQVLSKMCEVKNVTFFTDAFVPVANNVKSCGPVNYNTTVKFSFRTYNLYNDFPSTGSIRTILNQGAIFWYYATPTAANTALGLVYIMVNTPLLSFVPGIDCYVSLLGADYYYGFYTKSVKYPKQYIDFYQYQSSLNNYRYLFTVKISEFFTQTNFPETKSIAIK